MDRHEHPDLGAIAMALIDSNFYMTLGTADENGRPWASPVYYAHEGYAEFYWGSSPEATHSRNLEARPEVAIVIFDSRAPIGAGQGLYARGLAKELTGYDLEEGIAVFSRRSELHGAGEWKRKDVSPPARHRLYRATASRANARHGHVPTYPASASSLWPRTASGQGFTCTKVRARKPYLRPTQKISLRETIMQRGLPDTKQKTRLGV